MGLPCSSRAIGELGQHGCQRGEVAVAVDDPLHGVAVGDVGAVAEQRAGPLEVQLRRPAGQQQEAGAAAPEGTAPGTVRRVVTSATTRDSRQQPQGPPRPQHRGHHRRAAGDDPGGQGGPAGPRGGAGVAEPGVQARFAVQAAEHPCDHAGAAPGPPSGHGPDTRDVLAVLHQGAVGLQDPAEQLLVPGAGLIQREEGQRGADGRGAGVVAGLGTVPPWQGGTCFG